MRQSACSRLLAPLLPFIVVLVMAATAPSSLAFAATPGPDAKVITSIRDARCRIPFELPSPVLASRRTDHNLHRTTYHQVRLWNSGTCPYAQRAYVLMHLPYFAPPGTVISINSHHTK